MLHMSLDGFPKLDAQSDDLVISLGDENLGAEFTDMIIRPVHSVEYIYSVCCQTYRDLRIDMPQKNPEMWKLCCSDWRTFGCMKTTLLT